MPAHPGCSAQVGGIFLPQGTWRYPDPGRLLAERFGATAGTLVADLGVLQQTVFTHACLAIATGDLDVALVCGGEAKYRDLRARITGRAIEDTQQPDGTAPDERLSPEHEIMPKLERDAGLVNAPRQYSLLGPRCARRAVNRSARTRGLPVSCGRRSAAWRHRTPTRGDETR